jgi:hypothetical protein
MSKTSVGYCDLRFTTEAAEMRGHVHAAPVTTGRS